jgi:simple sugar transport system ATP-binding protein
VRPQTRASERHVLGGNPAKASLARERFPSPEVLLVGQPTRGVDIGAIEFIHAACAA